MQPHQNHCAGFDKRNAGKASEQEPAWKQQSCWVALCREPSPTAFFVDFPENFPAERQRLEVASSNILTGLSLLGSSRFSLILLFKGEIVRRLRRENASPSLNQTAWLGVQATVAMVAMFWLPVTGNWCAYLSGAELGEGAGGKRANYADTSFCIVFALRAYFCRWLHFFEVFGLERRHFMLSKRGFEPAPKVHHRRTIHGIFQDDLAELMSLTLLIVMALKSNGRASTPRRWHRLVWGRQIPHHATLNSEKSITQQQTKPVFSTAIWYMGSVTGIGKSEANGCAPSEFFKKKPGSQDTGTPCCTRSM